MKNEDKIVELLSEMLVKQDRFETRLDKIATGLDLLANSQERMISIQERMISVQERQENILIKILEVLADDVPKFDELIEMEQLQGKRVVLRKSK